MSNIVEPEILASKEPNEIIPIVWEFDDPTVVITAVSATATVAKGKDATPSNILGAASFSGHKATLVVQNGLHGVVYKIKMSITLTGGNRFVYTVLLPVLAL